MTIEQTLTKIGDDIRDIRTPGYKAGWNDALEAAANEIYDNNSHHYDSEMRSYARHFAETIRGMKK